jgi:hypothetical protein
LSKDSALLFQQRTPELIESPEMESSLADKGKSKIQFE